CDGRRTAEHDRFPPPPLQRTRDLRCLRVAARGLRGSPEAPSATSVIPPASAHHPTAAGASIVLFARPADRREASAASSRAGGPPLEARRSCGAVERTSAHLPPVPLAGRSDR